MEIDYLVIEDMLYTTLIRSYVLEFSSPGAEGIKEDCRKQLEDEKE